jgi:hypothetical protein
MRVVVVACVDIATTIARALVLVTWDAPRDVLALLLVGLRFAAQAVVDAPRNLWAMARYLWRGE